MQEQILLARNHKSPVQTFLLNDLSYTCVEDTVPGVDRASRYFKTDSSGVQLEIGGPEYMSAYLQHYRLTEKGDEMVSQNLETLACTNDTTYSAKQDSTVTTTGKVDNMPGYGLLLLVALSAVYVAWRVYTGNMSLPSFKKKKKLSLDKNKGNHLMSE